MVGDEDDVQRRRFRSEDVSREFGLTHGLSRSSRSAGLDLTSCDAPANNAAGRYLSSVPNGPYYGTVSQPQLRYSRPVNYNYTVTVKDLEKII